jgi:hypothetical protein
MAELCNANIKINDAFYDCHCEDGHIGPHMTRVVMKPGVINGFEWDIDDGGVVVLGMASLVAELVFEITRPDEPAAWDDTPF